MDNWKEMFDSIWKREGENFIQFLLDAGVKVNALNASTAMLSYAAERGNLEIIELLVQKGADCNAVNFVGSKPLHIAAKYGHKDAVKFFLDGGILADSSDNDGDTPLHYIAAKSNITVADWERYRELLLFLVDRQSDLNAENRDGCTPLLLAAKTSNKCTVEMLIESGADVQNCDETKWTVLHYTCRNGWLSVVKSIVSKGCDLNAKTACGRTSLLVAAENSYLSVVEFLIESGAEVECHNFNGWTVLHFACVQGWLGLVKSFVIKGCDINAKTACGKAPLLLAAENSHLSVVEYLIESGADVECRDYDASTVLHCACKFGWLDVVKSLVVKSFDLNATSIWNETALLHAAENCELEIIEHMLKAGKMGAYLMFRDYNLMTEEPLLKKGILQDTELCTRAVLNKFNNSDLPEIYEIPGVSEILPAVDKLKIATNTNVAQDIARCVEHEIETNGFCNVLNVHPIILSILSVKALSGAYILNGLFYGPFELATQRFLED